MPAQGSIARRLTVLVVAVGAVSIALHMALVHRLLDDVDAEVIERVAMHVGSIEIALGTTPPERREALARRLEDARVQLTHAPRFPPEAVLADDVLEALRPGLERRWPLPTVLQRIAHGPPTHALQARFELDGEIWWIAFERGPAPSPPLLGLALPPLAGVLLLGLAVAAASAGGVRWVTRPMARLAQALRARATQLRPLALPPRTPRELRAVIESFNHMVASLQAVDDQRCQWLAGLSHDLRTPMARLRLRAECELPDPVMRQMEPDFDALAHIVDQFLAYARGPAALVSGRIRPLVALLEEVVAQRRATVPIALDVEGADARWQVPDMAVRRLVGNLIDNAVAHGAPPVRVRLRADPHEVRLTVLDAGPGIAPERLPQALAPFTKLHGHADDLGHCGLGLAIVQQIARQLGGRLELEAHDGTSWGLGLVWPRPALDASCAATASA